MDIENELVHVLLPVHFQADITILSHEVGKVSSGDVVVAALEKAETTSSNVAPLVFAHVLFVVVVVAFGNKAVTRVFGTVEEDAKVHGSTESAKEVDHFDIVMVSTGSHHGFRHRGSVGAVTGLASGKGKNGAEHVAVFKLSISNFCKFDLRL